MKTIHTLLAASLWSLSCFAQESGKGIYPDPKRFEKAIEQFETNDRKNPPPQGAIVCIGSSSIRGWHGNIKEDLAPLIIIPRGFGGSNMNDALHYADRIVLPYKPCAIVLYEGDNDIAKGISPEQIAATFRAFVTKVHAELPECRIYVLSIKPSIKRWSLWATMQEANALMEATCCEDERLFYIDIATQMLNDEGLPKSGIFKRDQLHMTREGYVLWRNAVKPVLEKRERR